MAAAAVMVGAATRGERTVPSSAPFEEVEEDKSEAAAEEELGEQKLLSEERKA